MSGLLRFASGEMPPIPSDFAAVITHSGIANKKPFWQYYLVSRNEQETKYFLDSLKPPEPKKPNPKDPPLKAFHRCCFVCGRSGIADDFDNCSPILTPVSSRNGILMVCDSWKFGKACRDLLEKHISYLINVKGYKNFPVEYGNWKRYYEQNTDE